MPLQSSYPQVWPIPLPITVTAMTSNVDASNPDLVTVDVPTHWYNLAAELDTPIPPHLHPGTKEPVGPEDLAPLFASGLIAQEVTDEVYVPIPEPVTSVPTPVDTTIPTTVPIPEPTTPEVPTTLPNPLPVVTIPTLPPMPIESNGDGNGTS